MKRSLTIISMIFILAAGSLSAQAHFRLMNRGDRQFQKQNYPKALELYLRSIEKQATTKAYRKVAELYDIRQEPQKAFEWYKKVIYAGSPTSDEMLRYAELCKSFGKYEEAEKWIKKYQALTGSVAKSESFKREIEIAKKQNETHPAFTIKPININTQYSEIGVTVNRGKMYFASNRPKGGPVKRTDKRTRNGFYDIYSSRLKNNSPSQPKLELDHLYSKYNDGPLSFPHAGHFTILTRTRKLKRRERKDYGRKQRLGLFQVYKEANEWSRTVELPFNYPGFSSAHATLHHSEKFMVFSSDLRSGKGGKDLYVAYYQEDGGWSKPENLGPSINSSGDELFPVLLGDSLVFSTNGRPGPGRLDLHWAILKGQEFVYMGELASPMNSPYDDFSFFSEDGGKSGWFCSDRPGGKGDDDIYRFTRHKILKGQLVDGLTGESIDDGKIEMMTAKGEQFNVEPALTGSFKSFIESGTTYFTTVSAPGYKERKLVLDETLADSAGNILMDIKLDPIRGFLLEGIVTDEDGQPIPAARIRMISDLENNFAAGPDGRFSRPLDLDQKYTIIFSKEGFIPEVRRLNTFNVTDQVTETFDIHLRSGEGSLLEGIVLDKKSGKVLKGATLHIQEKSSQRELVQGSNDEDGLFWIPVEKRDAYFAFATFKGYFTKRIEIQDPGPDSRPIQTKFEMIPMELDKIVQIIYFEYGKSDIRKDYKTELEEIIYFLKDNPTTSLQLSSHTDSRGSKAFNQRLSEKRSDAAVSYIRSKGIRRSRIVAKGYGETKLVNQCSDGRGCSEQLHSKNRRTEVKVVKLH